MRKMDAYPSLAPRIVAQYTSVQKSGLIIWYINFILWYDIN